MIGDADELKEEEEDCPGVWGGGREVERKGGLGCWRRLARQEQKTKGG